MQGKNSQTLEGDQTDPSSEETDHLVRSTKKQKAGSSTLCA